MVEVMGQAWMKVLVVFLDKAYLSLERSRRRWAVIGSTASALQGCQIVPKDLDIIVEDPSTALFINQLMVEFLAGPSQVKSFLEETDGDLWLSSREKPICEGPDQWGFTWVFARWLVHDVRVEIAHITPPEGFLQKRDGIWEAGPEVWPYVKKATFRDFHVPVIPLEIQLETNYSRQIRERVNEIIRILKKNSYNEELLKRALSKQHEAEFRKSWLEIQ